MDLKDYKEEIMITEEDFDNLIMAYNAIKQISDDEIESLNYIESPSKQMLEIFGAVMILLGGDTDW